MQKDFQKPSLRRARGLWAEDLVVEELKKRKYHVLDRNYCCPGGELDIVAVHGEYLCFVEVRFRKETEAGEPLETVRNAKQRHLTTAARHYLTTHPEIDPMRQLLRFDVVSVVGEESPQIEVVEDAFGASDPW